MENPEISGIEYQQGDLQGYEVRELQNGIGGALTVAWKMYGYKLSTFILERRAQAIEYLICA